MEKLIIKGEYGGVFTAPEGINRDVWIHSVCRTLSKYEDTGLTPVEVGNLQAENARLRVELSNLKGVGRVEN